MAYTDILKDPFFWALLSAVGIGAGNAIVSEGLRSMGVYGLVRHPADLGNIVFCLGWAVVFRSTVGVALTVLWWVGFWLHVLIEEASLERTHGADCEDDERCVSWRIIPWPHFFARVGL